MFFKGQFLIYKNPQISYTIDSFDGYNSIFVANFIHMGFINISAKRDNLTLWYI